MIQGVVNARYEAIVRLGRRTRRSRVGRGRDRRLGIHIIAYAADGSDHCVLISFGSPVGQR